MINRIAFVLFICMALALIMYLTQLYRKFFEYKKILEMLIHIIRSYVLFLIITVPVIYLYFPFINIHHYLGYIEAILAIHIVSDAVYIMVFCKNNKPVENGSIFLQENIKSDKINVNQTRFVPSEQFIENIKCILFKNQKDASSSEIQNLSIVRNDKENIQNESKGILFLQPVDSVRRINKFFLKCYGLLKQEGILVFKIQPLEIKEENIKRKLRPLFFKLAYPFYFMFYRAFPKFRYINKLYFFITRGKNRWISKTEISGRLFYCGYDVVYCKMHDDQLIIIAQKDHEPLLSKIPSYYGLITLDRVGYEGKIIKIHKVRSMYPYSEFLQKKVFEENQISTTGKFNNDYRITNLGRIIRKLWIDELPQLLDWLRGDIKIVGIRAMSRHYFGLYPTEYQELYKKIKPGFFSPLFDEKNGGFGEIVKIEKEYLEKAIKNPLSTDLIYFFKILFQIIFKGTRSK
jgi:hypothetical protein